MAPLCDPDVPAWIRGGYGRAAAPPPDGLLIAGLVVLVGGMLGTAARGDGLLTARRQAGRRLYGLVEGGHASYASSARIMCLSTVIAAFFAPVEPFDIAVIAAFALYSWLVSIAWDAATGLWRPFTGPSLQALASDLRTSRLPRWSFAAVCGASVVAARSWRRS